MYSVKVESIYFEITSFCNRHCPYCYNDSDNCGEYMPKNIIYKIIDECASKNIKSITISGGEPFFHPDIDSILNRIEENNMVATIITNLSPITTEKAFEIISKGHFLQLTLDGIDAKTNDKTRGQGSFALIVALLKKACSVGLQNKIILRYNVSKSNITFLEDAINLAIYYKMRAINAVLLTKTGRGSNYEYVFDYNSDFAELINALQKMKALQEQYSSIINLSFSDLKDQTGCAFYSDGIIPMMPKIDSHGDVYICQLFSGKENALGNIYTSGIFNIVNSIHAHTVIDRVRERKAEQVKCRGCVFSDVCMCGCPAISYNQTGDLYEIEDQCSMIRYFLKERVKSLIK